MPDHGAMASFLIKDGQAAFKTSYLEAKEPRGLLLFSVGRGGNPKRHFPFLDSVRQNGFHVIAPHFELLTSPYPSKEDLDLRVRRLALTLSETSSSIGTRLPLFGVGHSIGATSLLILAGAKATTKMRELVEPVSVPTLSGLALFAPATRFFHRPNSLSNMKTGLKVWVGEQDDITTVSDMSLLKKGLSKDHAFDMEIDRWAGHFTFMHELPPNIDDPHPDRSSFLRELEKSVLSFILAQI